jgi:hypothetical protein
MVAYLVLCLLLAVICLGFIPLPTVSVHDLKVATGDVYSGQQNLLTGAWVGEVQVKFADGSTYVGTLRDGRFDGQGTFTTAKGKQLVGEFREGVYVQPGEGGSVAASTLADVADDADS